MSSNNVTFFNGKSVRKMQTNKTFIFTSLCQEK